MSTEDQIANVSKTLRSSSTSSLSSKEQGISRVASSIGSPSYPDSLDASIARVSLATGGSSSSRLSADEQYAIDSAEFDGVKVYSMSSDGVISEKLTANISGAVGSGFGDTFERLSKTALGSVLPPQAQGLTKAIIGSVKGTDSIVGNILGSVGGKSFSGNGLSGSPWGNLSKHLIARIYPCDADGNDLGLGEVFAPITDATFEASFNWQSPFENTGVESKAPALMAMIQTGQIGTVVQAIQAVVPLDSKGFVQEKLTGIANNVKDVAKDLEGRTGITKLNSRQVFSGMPPIKVNFTMHLRAISDTESEVQIPYRKLLKWALPQELAKDGVLTEVLTQSNSENSQFLKALFPSIAPVLVGMTYGNRRFAPMVIESVNHPIDGAMDSQGRQIYMPLQMSIATLTALDQRDVPQLFTY